MVCTRQKLIIIGGRERGIKDGGGYTGWLMNDVWARDDRLPTAFIDKYPRSGSSDSTFTFKCDELICYYEVRLDISCSVLYFIILLLNSSSYSGMEKENYLPA